MSSSEEQAIELLKSALMQQSRDTDRWKLLYEEAVECSSESERHAIAAAARAEDFRIKLEICYKTISSMVGSEESVSMDEFMQKIDDCSKEVTDTMLETTRSIQERLHSYVSSDSHYPYATVSSSAADNAVRAVYRFPTSTSNLTELQNDSGELVCSIASDGSIEWGDGSSDEDTALYRYSC
jgi:hypothetical protein